jgi:hypothetical protein
MLNKYEMQSISLSIENLFFLEFLILVNFLIIYFLFKTKFVKDKLFLINLKRNIKKLNKYKSNDNLFYLNFDKALRKYFLFL